VRVGPPAGEALDRLACHLAEVVVLLVSPGDPDQLEALRKRPLVGEVVQRGQQLAVRQVPGPAEDHQRGRVNRQPFEPLDERVVDELLHGRGTQ